MKTIKFIGKNIIRLNGIEYKGYNVGDLPNSFGFKTMRSTWPIAKVHGVNQREVKTLSK